MESPNQPILHLTGDNLRNILKQLKQYFTVVHTIKKINMYNSIAKVRTSNKNENSINHIICLSVGKTPSKLRKY